MRIFYRFYLQHWILLIFVIDGSINIAAASALQTLSCNSTQPYQRVQGGLQPSLGWLTSPSYPNSYPTQQRCIFELTAEPSTGLVIHLTFIDVDLEDRYSKSHQCLRDYLLLIITDREGREHLSERICGQNLPLAVHGMQPKIQVLFVSSYAISSRRGFKIRYEFLAEAQIKAPKSLYADSNETFKSECGGTLGDTDDLSGWLTSPGYPFTYPKNVTCNWLIRVSPDKRIYIRLVHLELTTTLAECDRASLLFIDGYHHEVAETAKSRRFGDRGANPDVEFCGEHLYYSEEGRKSYLSASNRVIIRFITKDYPSPDQLHGYEFEGVPIGFRLIWTAVNSLISDTSISITKQIDEESDEDISSAKSSNVKSLCGGFLCRGGEFCVDNGHNICAQRIRLCINETLKCDGVANCAENDNSDEDYCYSQNTLALAILLIFVILCILVLILYWWILRLRYAKIGRVRRAYAEKVAPTTTSATSPNSIHNRREIMATTTKVSNKTEMNSKSNTPQFTIKVAPPPIINSINKNEKMIVEEKIDKNCFEKPLNNISPISPSTKNITQKNSIKKQPFTINSKFPMEFDEFGRLPPPPPPPSLELSNINNINDNTSNNNETPIWQVKSRQRNFRATFSNGKETSSILIKNHNNNNNNYCSDYGNEDNDDDEFAQSISIIQRALV